MGLDIIFFMIVGAVGAIFITLTVSCSWGAAVGILATGGILKLVNKKIGWRSYDIYSKVLLIIGAVFTAASIVYTAGIAFEFSTKTDLPTGLFGLGVYYGIFSIGLSLLDIPAMIGVLLELIYREKRKIPFRVFGIILMSFAGLLLAATVYAIVYVAIKWS